MIKFCIPLILSGILQQLYNWADAFIVGNVAGENALAAIGSTTTIINLFLTAITGFTLGLSILFAQKFGAGKKDQISKTLSVFTVVLGCAFLLVPAAGIPGAYPLLRTMNTTPETIHMAKNYLQIILIGIPFLAVYNVYTSALRGIGNSRASFGSVLCSSVVNVVLGTGGYLISMFGISPESAEIGKNFFQRIAAFYVVYGIAMSIRGYTEVYRRNRRRSLLQYIGDCRTGLPYYIFICFCGTLWKHDHRLCGSRLMGSLIFPVPYTHPLETENGHSASKGFFKKLNSAITSN